MLRFIVQTPREVQPKKPRIDASEPGPATPHEQQPKNLQEVSSRRAARFDRFVREQHNAEFVDDVFDAFKRELLTSKLAADRGILKQRGQLSLKLPKTFGAAGSQLKAVAIPRELAAAVRSGQKLYLRGELDQDVTLCSASETFDIRGNDVGVLQALVQMRPEVHTEKSDPEEKQISAIVDPNVLLTVRRTTHDFDEVRQMLSRNALEFDANANSVTVPSTAGPTYRDLLHSVQISEGELRAYIRRLPVVLIQSKLYWMSHAFCTHLFDALVDAFDDSEHSNVEISSTTREDLNLVLESRFTSSVVDWIITNVFDAFENGLKLNEPRFVRERVRHLLALTPITSVTQLEKVADRILPAGCGFKPEYLEGIAILIPHASGEFRIQRLDMLYLPNNPLKRVKVLFEARDVWPAEELRAYLTDLFDSEKAMNEFLFENVERGTDKAGNAVFGGVIDSDCR